MTDYGKMTDGYWKEYRKQLLHNLESCDTLIRIGEIQKQDISDLVVRRQQMITVIIEIDEYLDRHLG